MSKSSARWALVSTALSLAWTALASSAEPVTVTAPDQECATDNLLAARQPIEAQDVSGNRGLLTDGAVAEEGADWDALPALILESTAGQLTYDLGQIREISSVYAQADANDTYTIWGSDQSTPSTFRRLSVLPVVVDRGPGLRYRAITFPKASIRYLKIAVGEGDNAYSVSEFAAYCRAPDPFPPVLVKAGTPFGSATPLTPPVTPQVTPVVSVTGETWLKLAGLIAIVAGTFEATRRRRGQRPAWTTDAAAQAQFSHRLLCGLFFVSGCAALIYEVVWFHLLRLVIGASAISMAIVLASFMGGMFLGSLFFSRFVRRSLNPVTVYAVLEIGIGAFGLLMPVILPAVKYIYIGLVGYGTLGIALRAVIAAVLLLPPTALMGATLPAVARRYPSGRRGMARLTSLYAANTLGAVAGCLVSAFYLLAVWDVWVSTLFAVALNLGLGAIALQFRGSLFAPLAKTTSPVAAVVGVRGLALGAVYVAAALSGLTSLGAQVIWTRLLTLLFGASVYAFAIILAIFLAGLGIGSAWASQLLRRGFDGTKGLLYSQLALIPTMLVGGYLLADALPYGSPPGWIPMQALHALHIVRAVVVVLPATIFWGTSFPFAMAAVGAGHDDRGRSTGLLYATNTIGAIIGTLAVSFWLIPTYGTHHAGQALILIAALSGACLLAGWNRKWGTLARPGNARLQAGGSRSLWPLALGALGVGLLPAFPKEFLAHGRYIVWVDPRDQYPYVSEGAASTVAVHIGPDGYSNFHVSGRVEATNNPNDLRTERLIGHLSAFAHPHPESVLVVGLGAGVTAGALTLHPEVKRIVICEIEPRVVGATNLFAKENYSVLSNPRVELVFDDARHFLATTREKFDIITSDPIHPWVRGNSILFSREYYAIVREHLKPGGLASQWVPLYETSELAIQIQAKTFMHAFADGTVWNTITNNRGYDVVFVGSEQPLRINVDDVQTRIDQTPMLETSLREVKLGGAIGLLSTYGTSGRDLNAWLRDIPINRDFSLKLEYISGSAMNLHQADEIYANMIASRKYPAQLFAGKDETLVRLQRRLFAPSMRQ